MKEMKDFIALHKTRLAYLDKRGNVLAMGSPFNSIRSKQKVLDKQAFDSLMFKAEGKKLAMSTSGKGVISSPHLE